MHSDVFAIWWPMGGARRRSLENWCGLTHWSSAVDVEGRKLCLLRQRRSHRLYRARAVSRSFYSAHPILARFVNVITTVVAADTGIRRAMPRLIGSISCPTRRFRQITTRRCHRLIMCFDASLAPSCERKETSCVPQPDYDGFTSKGQKRRLGIPAKPGI